MSNPLEKIADIDNGLKIAEFIQKNREEINKTYGRSAICGPPTRERVIAWNKHIGDTNAQNDGPQRGRSSSTGDQASKSNISQHDDKKASRSLSADGSDFNKSYDNRDHGAWDASDTVVSDSDWETLFAENHTYTEGRGDSEPERGAEPIVSSQDNGGANSSNRLTDREESHDDNDTAGAIPKSGLKETTTDDLKELIGESDPTPLKKLTNSTMMQDISYRLSDNNTVVKKTTEENTQSKKEMERQLSQAGATQCVLPSQQEKTNSSAFVGNVLENAQDVLQTRTPDEVPVPLLHNSSERLEKKIDEIIENQTKILSKINTVLEVKEELAAIKKILTNHSLALSTIDKYISDLMVVIPKSGVVEEGTHVDVNPDLRMVIGRDHTRGLMDVKKQYDKSTPIEVPEDLFVPPEIDQEYILKDIDNTKNNASNFVPTDDLVSKEIICQIIKRNVSDNDIREELISLVQDSYGKIPLKEVYATINQFMH